MFSGTTARLPRTVPGNGVASIRAFSSSSSSRRGSKKHGKSKKKGGAGGGDGAKVKAKSAAAVPNPLILPRRPGDSSEASKYPLPNQAKEKELAYLQDKVHDAYRSGSYREGLKHAQTYSKECVAAFGPDHPATASSLSDIGLFQKLLGDFDDARISYKKALGIYKRSVTGDDHANTASVYHNLGNLNRLQIHLDPTLKRKSDRLTLLEESLQSLELAYHIRLQERGPEHPHTVASRSSWGAALAMQLLQQQHQQQQTTTSSNTTTNTQPSSATLPTAFIYYQPPKLHNNANDHPIDTQSSPTLAWELAEEHLRQALQQAIDTPRGQGLHSMTNNNNKKPNKPVTTQTGIQTLSAASAAQNLAIFLKTRATAVVFPSKPGVSEQQASTNTKQPGVSESEQGSTTNPTVEEEPAEAAVDPKIKQQQDKWFQEAQTLYQDVLVVRRALLLEKHQDLYATKHSLAELLHAMGQEEEANVIRQEIIDTYHPEDEDNNDGDPTKESDNHQETTTLAATKEESPKIRENQEGTESSNPTVTEDSRQNQEGSESSSPTVAEDQESRTETSTTTTKQ